MDGDFYHQDDGTMQNGTGDHGRKRSSINSQSRDVYTKRPKEVKCGRYRTAIKNDVHDLSHVEQQSMEIESLPDSTSRTSIPLHQQSISHDSIYQQIVHQFSIGSGCLLLDDQHLLDPSTMGDVLNATLHEQIEWLDMVVYARQRAKAWDSTQYMRERNALKSWLR